MFLLIVIIILIAVTSILAHIYGGIFLFQINYGDLENYGNSHYSAISSIERGLLVTKYKEPSFVGSGGFIGTGNWGEISELFSGNFGTFDKNNNGLYREITSQCDSEIATLNNNNVLTIYTYTYNTTGHYKADLIPTSNGISKLGNLSGTFNNINNGIDLSNGSIYRVIKGDDKKEGYTGFVSSSGNTMLHYPSINHSDSITFDSSTINPLSSTNTGDTLCTQSGCYTGKTISQLITYDKGIILYIQDRLLEDNSNGQVGSIQYDLNNNFNGNCQNYHIKGTAIIGDNKIELNIKKPSFNYKNPNRKNFIFPYYN